jgi:hypothetical protein
VPHTPHRQFKPLDLLDCEVFAVVAQIRGELLDMAERDRIDAGAVRHGAA